MTEKHNEDVHMDIEDDSHVTNPKLKQLSDEELDRLLEDSGKKFSEDLAAGKFEISK